MLARVYGRQVASTFIELTPGKWLLIREKLVRKWQWRAVRSECSNGGWAEFICSDEPTRAGKVRGVARDCSSKYVTIQPHLSQLLLASHSYHSIRNSPLSEIMHLCPVRRFWSACSFPQDPSKYVERIRAMRHIDHFASYRHLWFILHREDCRKR